MQEQITSTPVVQNAVPWFEGLQQPNLFSQSKMRILFNAMKEENVRLTATDKEEKNLFQYILDISPKAPNHFRSFAACVVDQFLIDFYPTPHKETTEEFKKIITVILLRRSNNS